MTNTPFELVFGRKVNINQDLLQKNIEPLYNIDNYVKELKYKHTLKPQSY